MKKKTEIMVFGGCARVADYFNTEVDIVRFIALIAILMFESFPVLMIYILISVLTE